MSHPLHPTPNEESKCAQCVKEHDMDELRDKLAALTASHAACVRALRGLVSAARHYTPNVAAVDASDDALFNPLAREVSDGS